MRIVITGATGNVGTAVVESLLNDDRVTSIVGVARRADPRHVPARLDQRLSWVSADVATDDLDVVAGADAVIHLAWMIQPVRDPALLWNVNVNGTHRVVEAAVRHGVGRIIVASSVGVYSPRLDGSPVDESWPTGGVASSLYSREKAAVETYLDAAQARHDELTIVRMRTSLVFSRRVASEIARYFMGPLVPWSLIARGALPVLPFPSDVHFQVVHARDVADAYRLAALGDATGSFNIAAGPAVGASELSHALGARHVDVSVGIMRRVVEMSYAMRLQRTSPGWVDLAYQSPIMDTSRATTDLAWTPTMTSGETLAELIEGLAHRSGADTPPLRPAGRGVLAPLLAERTASTGRRA